MTDLDRTLIESTRTHRGRLLSAFVHGRRERRRRVNTNAGRFIGSVVVAAVACAGCLGTAFVLDILERQRNEQAVAAFRDALEANPIAPTDERPRDEQTGFLRDPETGTLIDPQTGFHVDPRTLLATDPQGRTIDPRIDWYYDEATGYYTDPASGVTIDPRTLSVVEDGPED
jgi:hypothetical protein